MADAKVVTTVTGCRLQQVVITVTVQPSLSALALPAVSRKCAVPVNLSMPAAVRALRFITVPLPAEQDGKRKSCFESASTASNLYILWSFSVSLPVPI